MNIQALTAALFVPVLGIGAALAQGTAATDNLAVNVGGIETVCTGSDYDARTDPKWRAYPMRLEFAGASGQYLGDAQISVTGMGVNAAVHCQGPWVLMKLPTGAYHVSIDVAEAGHKDIEIRVPSRTVVSFPNAGGKYTPPSRQSSAQERAATQDLNRKILARPNPSVHNPALGDHFRLLDTQYRTQTALGRELQQKYTDQLKTYALLNSQIQNWDPQDEQLRRQYQDRQNNYISLETPYEEQTRLNRQQYQDYQARLRQYEIELQTSR
jgi:hypothetical protein